MTPPPRHRAGMAIVRVELEGSDAGRVLLRITTVDDVTIRERPPDGEPFADVEAAFTYVRAWLNRWLAEA
jgi:hypothetical protein